MRTQTLGDMTIQTVLETERLPMRFADFCPLQVARHSSANAAGFIRGMAISIVPRLSCVHSYVVRTPHHNIVVDTCVGNDKHRPGLAEFNRMQTPWLDNLRATGISPEQVDFVMCTHLHSDHVGWNTRLHDGRWVPTFPNARYVFARREYECRERANAADDPNAATAFQDSILPVVVSGQALLVESDFALDDHVYLEPAEGHTPGNVVIHLRSRGSAGVLSGDVLHHPIQVMYPEWSGGVLRRSRAVRSLSSPVCRNSCRARHAGASRSLSNANRRPHPPRRRSLDLRVCSVMSRVFSDVGELSRRPCAVWARVSCSRCR